MKKIYGLLLGLISLFLFNTANAWQNEVSVGVGTGQEVDQSYRNNGVMLNAKLYKFCPIDNTLVLTIDGSLAHWHSTYGDHNELSTAALSAAFRAYFANPNCHTFRPYLDVSFGPTYLSARQLGVNQQGANVAFQSLLGGGMEVGNQKQSVDFGLHLAHYCNAGLFYPNHGINIIYIFSIGYQF